MIQCKQISHSLNVARDTYKLCNLIKTMNKRKQNEIELKTALVRARKSIKNKYNKLYNNRAAQDSCDRRRF